VPDPTRECALINVGEAVNEFLRSVRHSFPLVKLNDRNGFCRDESSKRDFSAWTNTESSSSSRQFSFDPKAAAVLHLNSQVRNIRYSVFEFEKYCLILTPSPPPFSSSVTSTSPV
jgi:hypothetical protein